MTDSALPAPEPLIAAPAATKPVSPLRRIAGDFVESPLAVVGLAGLLCVIFIALFASWIAPQNPYDLTQIRLGDARQPPGAEQLSEPLSERFAIAFDPTAAAPGTSDPVEATVGRDDVRSSGILAEGMRVLAVRRSEGEIVLGFEFGPEEARAPLGSVRIDDLPRGATLSAGEKHGFRDYWTVSPGQLDGLTIHSDRGFDRPLILDVRLTGAEQTVEMTYWLGTDGQGRDMLSAILYGLRISLAVGVMSGVAALVIGLSLGLIAAYFGGRTETLVMRLVDLQLSFPAILVALILMAVFTNVETGTPLLSYLDEHLPQYKVIMALIIVQWAYYARTARGAALVERRKEYIEAAACLALSQRRIIFRHLLPNCLPPVIVVGTVQVANAIALEATLSFLGIGLPITQPSLGLLISNGFDYLLSGRYWISVYPGVALLITIVSINLVGDQLRDILNPRLQK